MLYQVSLTATASANVISETHGKPDSRTESIITLSH